MLVLNAGWEEGRLPNMTNGHVFVREPVNQVPCLQYGIGYILFINLHMCSGFSFSNFLTIGRSLNLNFD